MKPDHFLVAGNDQLAAPPLRVLNLWTETEECHLGHLHLLETAKDVIRRGHQLMFYVGEFPSSFWATTEYLRREDSYRVACTVLKELVPGADADYGVEFPHDEVSRGLTAYGHLMIDVGQEPPLLKERKDLEGDGITYFRKAYRKPWGVQTSPFLAIFALYAKRNNFNALLIAERHLYIGEALTRFARIWLGHNTSLLVVRDFPACCRTGAMTQQNGSVKMQAPIDYFRHELSAVLDEGQTEAQREVLRMEFIRHCHRCFLKRDLDAAAFDSWWNGEGPKWSGKSSDFCSLMDTQIFRPFQNTYYGAIPETRAETQHRIDNAYLLRYVDIVLGDWKRPPRLWADKIEDGVNTDAQNYESTLYHPSFDSLGEALLHENLPTLPRSAVEQLLKLTEQNRTTDLLLFFGSRKRHRDHYVHTFNVAALGQFLLDLHVFSNPLKASIAKQLGCEIREVEVAWWLTAMLHDHAYPLFSMMQWLLRLQHLAEAFAKEQPLLVELANAHLKQLSTLVHNSILKPLMTGVEKKTFGLDRLWEDVRREKRDLFWFLDDDDTAALLARPPLDHAFCAVLNLAYFVRGRPEYRTKLGQQILRGILFHTHISFTDGKPKTIEWKSDPLAYLLLVCDEIQEWSRRILDEERGMRVIHSELLLAPLVRRYESKESWQLPRTSELEVTIRYRDEPDMRKWTSDDFLKEKSKVFARLKASSSDPVPRIRLAYALAFADTFPPS